MDRPLQELPILTKEMIMEHFDELVTDRDVHLSDIQHYLAHADQTKPFLDRYQVLATSGSTGQPGIFLSNRAEGIAAAHTLTRFQSWGGVTTESRVALLSSPLPVHITARFPIIINGQSVSNIRLPTTLPREELVQRLNEWQPDVLFGYPSLVSALAYEQRQGRLHIAPRSIGCTGETVTGEIRRQIEEIWQAKLFNMYALTECAVLAAECTSHQGLHLFEDFSLVEVVDEDNRPVPPGQVGAKVLLTALYRRTQPLIRYEVSDRVRLSSRGPCPCGRPFAKLEAIEGRTGQGLSFATTTGGEEQISTLQFETIFDALPVSGWQIVQEIDGLHLFLAGASEELDQERLIEAVRQLLSGRGVIVPPIQVHLVETLTRNMAGKAPVLLSHLPRHES
jgi:phenylacetate-coenzyme A ligase PaaK-like adenylate-forming protein